jgi:excisionase family DNA binding protein
VDEERRPAGWLSSVSTVLNFAWDFPTWYPSEKLRIGNAEQGGSRLVIELTVRDAAALLNTSEKSIYRWIKQGVLPAYRINDQYRISRAELLEWATAHKKHVSPEIFEEPQSEDVPPPSLEEALRAGGIHYRVGGTDKASVLRAVVETLNLPDDSPCPQPDRAPPLAPDRDAELSGAAGRF